MKQTAYYEAFAYNPATACYDIGVGTATLDAIKKAGLKADLEYLMYGDETVDGWAFKVGQPRPIGLHGFL